MNHPDDEMINSGWLYRYATKRYRWLGFHHIIEILLWVAAIYLAIVGGMINLSTPSSVSFLQRESSIIFLVLLLITAIPSLLFYQDHTADRFIWLMKKDLLRHICPNCRYDLRGQNENERGHIVCPECGSPWGTGKALDIKKCETVYHVIWMGLQRFATLLSITYMILYFYFSVNFFFFTVGSVEIAIGVSASVTFIMKIWYSRCLNS